MHLTTMTLFTSSSRPFRPWLLSAALLAAAGTASAAMQAVLVGVSDYPTLKPEMRLEGPRNDVQRMRRVLMQQSGFTVEAITTLADGVPGAGNPTRANILAALKARIAALKSGDTLVVYFAGHGSQQPADRNTPEGRAEPDGLHEIFLPIDIGQWDGKAGTVKNAIVDHELRALMDQAIAKGAFVWGIFDACHSASLVRGGGPDPEVRFRQVSPDALGITPQMIDRATANLPRTRGGPGAQPSTPMNLVGADKIDRGGATPAGGSAFFYAAQTTEVTPEMRLPFGDPQRTSYGLFSFMLTQAMESGQPMSYRQLAQFVLSRYGGVQEARVTPVFAGTGLDRMVLGQTTLRLRQWPVAADRLTVPIGSLAGLAPGAVFAVLPGPESPDNEAQGYLVAQVVELNGTTLVPAEHGGLPRPDPARFKPGMQARLIGTPERLTLRVSVDASKCGSTCAWQPVVARLRQQGVPGVQIEWVNSGADLQLRLEPDRLSAVPPSSQGAQICEPRRTCRPVEGARLLSLTQGARIDVDAASGQLAQELHKMARTGNLLRLASGFATQTQQQRVEVGIRVKAAAGGGAARLTPEPAVRLVAGDLLSITVTNQGSLPQDVTVLYVDAKFGITALFPRQDGEVNRLEPGARLPLDDIEINDNDGVFGLERLLVISVPATRHAERADFSFLAQPAVRSAEVRTRSGGLSEDFDDFVQAAFGGLRTRGPTIKPRSAQTGMQVFTFDLKPSRP